MSSLPKPTPTQTRAKTDVAAGALPVADRPALEEDRALLDGFRAGDRGALGEVFKRYLPIVMRALRGGARAHVGGARIAPGINEQEIEALAQETFLRAFSPSARDRYDGLRPYSAYIATIAKNLLIDAARKRGRTPTHIPIDDLHGSAIADRDAGDVPLRQIEEKDLANCVTQFRAQLKKVEAEVFRVRFVEQHSLRAAATLLGQPVFAVRKIDIRLRLDLLTALREAGFCEETKVSIGTSALKRPSASLYAAKRKDESAAERSSSKEEAP